MKVCTFVNSVRCTAVERLFFGGVVITFEDSRGEEYSLFPPPNAPRPRVGEDYRLILTNDDGLIQRLPEEEGRPMSGAAR